MKTILSSSFLPQVEAEISFVTDKEIDLERVFKLGTHHSAGGLVYFLGNVRDLNVGKPVSHLDYEAYIPMAEKMIHQILIEAAEKYNLVSALAVHRIGRVDIGETAVVIGTSHKHRGEAYRANEEIIDRVKHEVPIWKKEFFADGTHTWGGNCSCH
ncbi:MAG TPA: molybdenum cofactor biosynthesis protein MoaE [Cytophagaceae bacterium]